MHTHRSTLEILEARIAPATVYAVNASNQLFSFDAYEPTVIGTTLAITGLDSGETVEGIDFRPADGLLYAVTNESRIYTINTISGAATQVGSGTFVVSLTGLDVGFDFNPVVDRMRVITDTRLNFRVNPTTGNAVDSDPGTGGFQTDNSLANVGVLSAAAYTNNYAGAVSTTLYDIDTQNDRLYFQGDIGGTPSSPNSGSLTQVGPGLGVNATGDVGFDIGRVYGAEAALASLQVAGVQELYSIDLGSGRANLIGTIGSGSFVKAIAISPEEKTIAPTLVNAKTATYTDLDGDLVTVSISKGTLSAGMFRLRQEGPNNRAVLELLDLTLDPLTLGANVTISAKRSEAFGGDGQVNVGYLKANNLDLGKVVVEGDLARIDAGGGSDAKKSITSLDALSMGSLGLSTQSAAIAIAHLINPGASTALSSTLLGGVTKINIRGSIVEAAINVTGGTDADVGTVNVFGDIIGGSGQLAGAINIVNGSLNTLKVTGSLVGGSGAGTGYVFVSETLKTATISGSLIAGAGPYSGMLEGATLGTVTVGGDLLGGPSSYSGAIYFNTHTGKATIKGSLDGSASLAGTEGSAAFIMTHSLITPNPNPGLIGTVTIGGSLVGGLGKDSGAVVSPGLAKSVTVGGSLYGSDGEHSGSIYTEQLGKATVGGSLYGGLGLLSGAIAAEDTQEGGNNTSSVTVGGNVRAINNDGGGIIINGKTGKVKIGGSVIGEGLGTRVLLRFSGVDISPGPKNAGAALAVSSITIGGDVRNADILAGYDGDEDPFRGDAGIGSLKIDGSVFATNIIAGIDKGNDGVFGTFDDTLFSPRTGSLLPTIGPITIKGQLLGSPGGADGFVISAAVLKSIKVAGTSIPLSSKTLDLITAYGAGRDISIIEVPLVS